MHVEMAAAYPVPYLGLYFICQVQGLQSCIVTRGLCVEIEEGNAFDIARVYPRVGADKTGNALACCLPLLQWTARKAPTSSF